MVHNEVYAKKIELIDYGLENIIYAVTQVWYRKDDFKKIYIKLVNSMPSRIKMIINAMGGHIEYKQA